MDGDLSSRIKCGSCGAESYNNGKTKLHCPKCYDKLQAENKRLEAECRRMTAENLGLRTEKKNLEIYYRVARETIEKQGKACAERHELLCEVKEITDRYFNKALQEKP